LTSLLNQFCRKDTKTYPNLVKLLALFLILARYLLNILQISHFPLLNLTNFGYV